MIFRICRLFIREVSGVGPIRVRQSRVRQWDNGPFSSAILPKYMRRAPGVDALIPALYLKGISTGDLTEVLEAILGEGASGSQQPGDSVGWFGS
jgi:putative transposase